MASKNRTIVGSPMTPAMMVEVGAADSFPPIPTDFSPTDEWTHTYRIWTCHGYIESGNDNDGFLKISRRGGQNRTFILDIDQRVAQSEGDLHVMKAKVRCHRDTIASPSEWTLISVHYGSDGKIHKDLSVEEKARRNGDILTVVTNGKKSSREIPMTLTADWCLFEAVQRLPFDDTVSMGFDLLEGMTIHRTGHKLTYRGVPVGNLGNMGHLQGFHQLGKGLLPYEWWLDDQHRLVMLSTFSRVYILDDNAESMMMEELESGRSSYQNKLERRK